MKFLIHLIAILFVSITVLTSCDKDEVEPNNNLVEKDNLEKIGIFGQWKLDTYEYGGIMDLSIKCCDTLQFKADDNAKDNKGAFTSTSAGGETKGTFELNESNSSILFLYDGKQRTCIYTISDNSMELEFTEDGVSVIEGWRRVE